MAMIVIDAGHGGFDNGAMYQGRKEKDDNLRLALAVGKILEQQGYDVVYTRTADVYQSPYEKAQIGNDAGADYFISFHRNSGEDDNTYNGVQTLIYGGDERAERLADAINSELEKVGFANLGIEERTGLAVLRRTEMPAVLIEAGFINHDRDNEIFDNNFNEVASAIAMGIEQAVPLRQTVTGQEEMDDADEGGGQERFDEEDLIYGVEVGRFGYRTTANFLAEQLMDQGFESFVAKEVGLFRVVAGKEDSLEDAVALKGKLRDLGYRTLIVATDRQQM